jgi:hypothetical protein
VPAALQPIAIGYTPDAKLPEGRAIISLSLDFAANNNQVIDFTSIRSVRPFSGVKGIYIEFEAGGAATPLTVTVNSTGQIFNLDTAAHSCTYLPISTVPSDKILLTATAGKANIILTNFEMKPLRYRTV